MSLLDMLFVGLAAFYVSFAVSSISGPFHVFEWLREHLPLGGLTDCMICLAPWAAALFYVLLLTPIAWLTWIFAGAGLAVFVWRWTGGSHV